MQIVITGGLGFVGSEMVRALLARADVERVILLARARGGRSPAERFAKMVATWERFGGMPLDTSKVEIMDHDLATMAPPIFTGPVDYIIHAAASTDLGERLDRARRANLFATAKLLLAARNLPGLKRFVHVSTAYVCGRRKGIIRDDENSATVFHNDYERSKWEAEECVRGSGVPYSIVRPSMVVGRSDSGFAQQMKVLYGVWRIWLLGLVRRAPLTPSAWVDIVPVDYVVEGTLALMTSAKAASRSCHLCAGRDRQQVSTLMKTAAGVFKVAVPLTWPVSVAYLFKKKPFYLLLPHSVRELLDYMIWHLPYLTMKDRLYDTTAIDLLLSELGVHRPTYQAYGETLFRFLKDTSWGKRPALTVTDIVAQKASA